MVTIIIVFGLGYFLWKYAPKMISKCSKKTRRILEIVGIVSMVLGAISFINYISSIIGLWFRLYMYRCVFFLLLLSIIPFSIKAQTVYVCSGSGATKYHLRSNCRGLNTCTGEVLEIKEQQALREKRTKCIICGNKTSSSSKTQELSAHLQNPVFIPRL